jgi:hypothetical protein
LGETDSHQSHHERVSFDHRSGAKRLVESHSSGSSRAFRRCAPDLG